MIDQLTLKIKDYLISNPIDRDQENPYEGASKTLGVDKERVRSVWRNLRNKGLVEKTLNFQPQHSENKKSIKIIGNNASLQANLDKEVKNEKDLAFVCDIDTSEWTIVSWECKRYNAWIKNSDGKIEEKPLYSVGANLKRRIVDTDLGKQKELILKELYKKSPSVKSFTSSKSKKGDYLFEISIPDLHVGKLAWNEESGEDYDLKIASSLYNKAIQELLSLVDTKTISRILLPVGNDMCQIDNRKGETTAGTVVDSDSRYFKIVRTVKQLIIKNVEELSKIAPVDILIISGNHDYETMWTIGEMLDAYFHNNKNVTVNNSPNPRKYYNFGKNGFLYTHGNEEKHQELGLIFATEQPELWAKCTTRVAKLGHLHKSKKTNFVSVDEHQGFQVQILPSLSKSDFWHKSKGYMSKQAAKGFLYSRENGLIAEYNYNV